MSEQGVLKPCGRRQVAWHLRNKRSGIPKIPKVRTTKPIKPIKPIEPIRPIKPIAPIGKEYYWVPDRPRKKR